jgi:hypothetical protein
MMQSFTVVPLGTRIFSTKMSNVKIFLPKATPKHTRVWYKAMFDNFRTWSSPASTDPARDCNFRDYEMQFMYETEHSDRMMFKFFKLAVYCDFEGKADTFMGEATIDLYSLATGPEDVFLSIYDGDVEAGVIGFTMIFQEQAQVGVRCDRLAVSVNGAEPSKLWVTTKKRGDDEDQTLATDGPDEVNGSEAVFLNSPEHYFGVSVVTFLEGCGYEVSVYKKTLCSSDLIASCSILFSAFMKEANMEETVEVATVLKDPEGVEEVGKLTATFEFQNLPKFLQMYGGKNVNGCVVDGKMLPGNAPKPLYVDEKGLSTVAIV